MKEHVLLIEPNSTLRTMFQNILEEENYLVDVVKTLSEGLRFTPRYGYLYALVDVPAINQQDLASLKSLHASQTDMNIVVFTDQPEVKNYFFDHGCADYGIKAVFSSLFKLDQLLLFLQSISAHPDHGTPPQQDVEGDPSSFPCSISRSKVCPTYHVVDEQLYQLSRQIERLNRLIEHKRVYANYE